MSVKDRFLLFYKSVKAITNLKARGQVVKVRGKSNKVIAVVKDGNRLYKVRFEFIGEDFFIRSRCCTCSKDLCGHMLSVAKRISTGKRRLNMKCNGYSISTRKKEKRGREAKNHLKLFKGGEK